MGSLSPSKLCFNSETCSALRPYVALTSCFNQYLFFFIFANSAMLARRVLVRQHFSWSAATIFRLLLAWLSRQSKLLKNEGDIFETLWAVFLQQVKILSTWSIVCALSQLRTRLFGVVSTVQQLWTLAPKGCIYTDFHWCCPKLWARNVCYWNTTILHVLVSIGHLLHVQCSTSYVWFHFNSTRLKAVVNK